MTRLWTITPREAMQQILAGRLDDSVLAEASGLLSGFERLLRRSNGRFSEGGRSATKASWLLVSDAQLALRDATDGLLQKRFRGAAVLFRAAEEAMAMSLYFKSGAKKSKTDLKRWYASKSVFHSRVRDWIEEEQNTETAKASGVVYEVLSGLSHRSYSAVLHGRTPVPNRKIHLSDYLIDRVLIPIRTSADYIPVLVWLINRLSDVIGATGLARMFELREIRAKVLGEEPRCSILTKQGARCQRPAATGRTRCWQHVHAT